VISDGPREFIDLDSHDDTVSSLELFVQGLIEKVRFEKLKRESEFIIGPLDDMNEDLSVADETLDRELLAVDPRVSTRHLDGPASRPILPIVFNDLIPQTIKRTDGLVSLREIPSSDLKGESLVSDHLSPIYLKSSDRDPMISSELP
jgi:hypothetical protein